MKLVGTISAHPVISALVLVVAASLLARGCAEGATVQVCAYLGAIALSAVVVDLLASRAGTEEHDIPVRNARKEILWLLLTLFMIAVLSSVRFLVVHGWEQTPFWSRVPFYVLTVLFTFPTVLLALFLRWGYRLRDIGFRFKPFWIGIPVVIVFGVFSTVFAPEKNQFANNFRDLGYVQTFFVSFVVAGTPEEFVRYLTQTRLGKLFGNYAAGWLVASVIWASLHLPSFYAHSSRGLSGALWTVFAILPLGLLWSFMNHRTRSIIPAVIVHGTNLWALQDF